MGSTTDAPLRVELLGPLRVLVGGVPVEVPGPKRRATLVLLALAEGRTVTVGQLLDAMWPTGAPDSGRQAVHTHVSRLRADLGDAAARLHTSPSGYRLELAADDLDVSQVRSLLAAARDSADPATALALLREAEALWRGPVLADLAEVLPVATAVAGFELLRREVSAALVDRAIDAGRAQEVLAVATAGVAADPLHETAVRLLVRALAATGQAPEALRTARDFRHRLAEETGLDPSPALAELERAVASGAAGPGATAAPTGPADPIGPAALIDAAAPSRPGRPTGRMFGREADVGALHQLLASERLVTLTGPGGVGKTRLATEVAWTTDVATVLLLAPITDPGAVPHALAASLGISVTTGDVLGACVSVLTEQTRLLVVDNCEHLLDAARTVVDAVLAGCPGVTVLATSREPLGHAVEHVHRLPALPVPALPEASPAKPADEPGPAAGDVAAVPSVAFFSDRARRVGHSRPLTPEQLVTVAAIVRRLDGMPLAIELAAGRLSSFSLEELHARLDRSLDLLGGTRAPPDARHRTLRATVEWSYDLLDDECRRLFRHLSVFVDGVDLTTAERVARDLEITADPAAVLARLVDTSMLESEPTQRGTRFRMLQTLRDFGLDRLDAAGETDAATDAFLRWAVEKCTWIGRTLESAQEPDADAALRLEMANLRAAVRLARTSGRVDDAAEMVVGLFDAITYRDLVEIRDWASELAADPALAGRPREALVLVCAAEAAYHRGELATASSLAGRGSALAVDDHTRRAGLLVQSVVALARGQLDRVERVALEAAALETVPRESRGIAALAITYGGDPARAGRLVADAVATPVSPSMQAWAAYVDGEICAAAGDGRPAEEHYRVALDLAERSGATFLVGVATVGLLSVLAGTDRTQDALRGYGQVVEHFARTGNWTHQWTTLRNLARLLVQLGDTTTAEAIVLAADHAPDAPAVAGAVPRQTSGETVLGRGEVLAVAREAIVRHTRDAAAGPVRAGPDVGVASTNASLRTHSV